MVISSQVRAADAMATTIRTAIGTHLLRGPVRAVGSSGPSASVSPVVSVASVLMLHHLLCPTPSWQRMHDTVSPLRVELLVA